MLNFAVLLFLHSDDFSQRQRQTAAFYSMDSLGVHNFYACRDAVV